MAEIDPAPRTLGQVIDRIERMREELLMIQNALQKLEPPKPDASREKQSKVGRVAISRTARK